MFQQYLEKIQAGEDLTRSEAARALEAIIEDQVSATEIGALLMGLRMKGESEDEIAGFVDAMEKYMVIVSLKDPDAIDVCGTGGDGKHTFNVSTTAAFIISAAGVTVAKHGNRSISSKSGSADVLKALGINIEMHPEQAKKCADEIGLTFFYAPLYHPAMHKVAPHRKNMGIRTVFNMIGPLLNPARVRRQLIGTFNLDSAQKLAGVLSRLNIRYA
jgi:anthranilate phosphoribosyltransferase